MTEDQVKVMRVIFTMIWQSIFSGCVLIGWFIILFKWVENIATFDQTKFIAFGAIESFLSLTIALAFRYWFAVGNKGDRA